MCGAAYGTRSPERTNRRNGYGAREFDTRAGTLELAVRQAVLRIHGRSLWPGRVETTDRRVPRALLA